MSGSARTRRSCIASPRPARSDSIAHPPRSAQVNAISFDKPVERDYTELDSFVIYICTEGGFRIKWDGNTENVSKGETILIPAVITNVILESDSAAETLEIYINNPKND